MECGGRRAGRKVAGRSRGSGESRGAGVDGEGEKVQCLDSARTVKRRLDEGACWLISFGVDIIFGLVS